MVLNMRLLPSGSIGRAVQCPRPLFSASEPVTHRAKRCHMNSQAAAVDSQPAATAVHDAEASGDQPGQQSRVVSPVDSSKDLTSTSTDISVDDPPGFVELGVDPLLAASLSASGIQVPSPIQEVAIPQLLQGHNTAVQSYTGSGKTLAYLLPAMTLALRRAEAAFKRQRLAAAQRQQLSESDTYSVQVLIVAPSQELSMQICRVAADLLPGEGRGAVQQAIGGANMRRQAEAIAENQPLVVVGTPGRLADLIRLGSLRLHRCPVLILDEADQLLGDIYTADMRHITEHCGKRLKPDPSSSSSVDNDRSSSGTQGQQTLVPTQMQTILVSATLWDGVLSRFNSWCPGPTFITTGGAPTWVEDIADSAQGLVSDTGSTNPKTWGWGVKGWEGPASVVQQGPKTQGTVGGAEGSGLVPTLPPNLEHMFLVVNPQHKADAVRRAMYALNVGMGLGFMNWQQRLKDVAAKVAAKKIEVGLLHGELSSAERASVLDAARKGAYQLLLVSDVAARGLDMPKVDVVFNIELPSNAAHYAHRAGRTGRMGAPGLVVTLVAPGERFVMERLSKKLTVPVLECHLARGELVVGPPAKKDIKKKQQPASAAVADPEKAQQLQQRQEVDRKQANSKASSSSSTRKQQLFDTRSILPPSSAGADGEFDDAVDDLSDSDSDDYIIDEDDDVAVEGDEPFDVYRSRVHRGLDQELEEIRQEKAAARQQRYQQKQAARHRPDRSRSDLDPEVDSRSGPDLDLLDQDSARKPRRSVGARPPRGSPEEAAAMAMAAIAADENARKAKSKLPAVLLSTNDVVEDRASKSSGDKRARRPPRQQQQRYSSAADSKSRKSAQGNSR